MSDEKLSLGVLTLMLLRLSKRAGVRCVTPNLFGKVKLSHMADDGYNACQIKKYAGHLKIETALFYVKLSQKGFEQAIKKKDSTVSKEQFLLQSRKCWKCGSINKSSHTRCRECGKILDLAETFKELNGRSDLIASVMPEEMLEQLAELVVEKLKQHKFRFEKPDQRPINPLLSGFAKTSSRHPCNRCHG